MLRALRWLPARARSRFDSLRLVWKLLLPYGVLILVLAGVGSFVAARTAATQAQHNLDNELRRVSLATEAHLHDRALFLTESAQVGANTEGVPEAATAGDAQVLRERLASLVGSRLGLDFVVVTDRHGLGLVELTRGADGVAVSEGSRWEGRALVADLLQGLGSGEGARRVDFLPLEDRVVLAAAAPLEADGLAGVVIAGIDARRLVAEIGERARAGAAFYDDSGVLQAGTPDVAPAPPPTQGSPIRRTEDRQGGDVSVLYAPLDLQGTELGTFAVGLPTEEYLGSVGGTRLRISLLLAAGMGAVVAMGVMLSRAILRPLPSLVRTRQALGKGELGARAEVFGSDELGELASGMNEMAEQLQASRDELERKVEERTEELQRLYGELIAVTEGRTEMFSSVVHDLRSHLFVIAGYVDLIADPSYRPGSRRWREEFGHAMAHEVEAVTAQIEEILEVSRAASGRIELDLTEVEILELLDEVRPTIVGLGRAAEIEVEFDLPAALPPARADRRRLTQVVMNLASNAVKYTPPGGYVRLSAAGRDGLVEITVADTGIGIPEGVGDRIFEPFYQAPGATAQKGQAASGLGLAIVKRLVEAHGGRVGFESDRGKGTAFRFTVPVATPRSNPRLRRAGRAPVHA